MSRVGRSVRAISSIRISGRSGLTNKRARREEARESGSAAAEGTGETRLHAGAKRIRTAGPSREGSRDFRGGEAAGGYQRGLERRRLFSQGGPAVRIPFAPPRSPPLQANPGV